MAEASTLFLKIEIENSVRVTRPAVCMCRAHHGLPFHLRDTVSHRRLEHSTRLALRVDGRLQHKHSLATSGVSIQVNAGIMGALGSFRSTFTATAVDLLAEEAGGASLGWIMTRITASDTFAAFSDLRAAISVSNSVMSAA